MNNLTCPHCDYELSNEEHNFETCEIGYGDEDMRKLECPKCKKIFYWQAVTSIDFYSYKTAKGDLE